jgi:hypothetical protein
LHCIAGSILGNENLRPFSSPLPRRFVEINGSIINWLLWLDHLTSKRNELTEGIQIFTEENLTKVAIFATYSGRKFDNSDISVMSTLRTRGYSVYVVSNGDKAEIELFDSLISKYIWRKNFGYDLGAYRDSFLHLNHDVEQVLIINDSIYWPENRFDEMLEILELGVNDGGIIGITESLQRSRHIQSFCFLVKGKNSILNFEKALGNIKNWRYKRSAVTFGELKFTKYLASLNQEVKCIYSYEQILKNWRLASFVGPDVAKINHLLSKNVHLNPTQHFWRVLYMAPGGFLKRSLIEKNPAKLMDVPLIEDLT